MSKLFEVRITYKGHNTFEQTYFAKINHALRFLWKSRNVAEAYLYVPYGEAVYRFVAKIGRRRGLNLELNLGGSRIQVGVSKRPLLKKAGDGWMRLPNKYNDFK